MENRHNIVLSVAQRHPSNRARFEKSIENYIRKGIPNVLSTTWEQESMTDEQFGEIAEALKSTPSTIERRNYERMPTSKTGCLLWPLHYFR